MTGKEYFTAPGINATAIKAGRQSMRLMHHVLTTRGKPATPAMRMGTLIHAAVLEPDTVSTWAVRDAKNWTGKGVAEWKAEHADQTQVLAHEVTDLLRISAAVHANRDAAWLINATRHEVPLFWDGGDQYGQAKARADGVAPGILMDLKTTKGDIDDRTIERLSWNMGYHVQLGWYREGANAAEYAVPTDGVYIIWLRQGDDLDCRVSRLSTALVEVGAEQAIDIAHRYRVHEACGTFPGVSSAIETLEAPAWTGLRDDDWEVPEQ
jgi:hypothetical protein